MDITLIPQAESRYDKKYRKIFLTDGGMTQLTDCSLVLLHKAGMRPLYLMTNKGERIVAQPEHAKMTEPDLILYSDTEPTGEQSAKVIQEQLKTCNCSAEISNINFSMMNKSNAPEVLKNVFATRIEQLSKKGYHHIVIVANSRHLDTIARCMNQTGLNQAHNIPVYSFSDGQEIRDRNLIDNFYITRELLDHYLIGVLSRDLDQELSQFKNKCSHSLEIFQLKKKLHLPE